MIRTKTLATAVALILTLSIATTAFAQNATSGTTGLQIQVVPQIQRGHQQHLTIFSVDDQGNQVNASEIQTTITNEKGNLVGPKTLYTQSGEDVAYKVGPNTRPQNITIDSCLTEQELCATQSYYVFPKGQAQQPEPLPPVLPEPEVPEANNTGDGEIVVPSNDTEVNTPETGNETLPEEPVPFPPQNETEVPPVMPPMINETAPVGNETTEPVPFPPQNETIPIPELPVTNQTQNTTVEPEPLPPSNGGNGDGETAEQPAFNATTAFDSLGNSTTILDEKLGEVRDGGNDTNRGELKLLVSETLDGLGTVSQAVINATDDQLLTVQGANSAVSESIDEFLNPDEAEDDE